MSTPLVDAPLRVLSSERLPAFRPVIVADERCKGCGLCAAECPAGAIAMAPEDI